MYVGFLLAREESESDDGIIGDYIVTVDICVCVRVCVCVCMCASS